MSFRVYRYGLLPPTENADVIRDQMRFAHVYRNKLVEIERARRAEVRRIHSTVGDIPVLEASNVKADEAFDAALKVVLRARARARSRNGETPEMKAALLAARETRSVARKALSEARKKLRKDPAVVKWVEASSEKVKEAKKAARADSGMAKKGPHIGASGTYERVEEAAESSSKKTPLYDGAEPLDPRFIRAGLVSRRSVAFRPQGGFTPSAIFACDDFVQIEPVQEGAWLDRSGGEARLRGQGKRAKMKTTLRLRLCRMGGKDVFGVWPMTMHRPLPEGGLVKNVFVTEEKLGPRSRWYVCFVVDEGDGVRLAPCGEGKVAVGFGWRTRPEGNLRVAVYADSAGEISGLELDAKWIAYAKKAQELRSLRDKNFDEARVALVAWLVDRELPEWLAEARTTLGLWKSPGRLAALAKRWRLERFEGDEDGYLALETWRYRDQHLWEWETNQRDNSQLQRRERYRIIAKQFPEQYGELVLGKFDRREIAKRKDKSENETARSNRQLSATSELEGALVNAFRRAGGKITYVKPSAPGADGKPSVGLTHQCHVCRFPCEFDAAASLVVKCEGCGAEWDQDENFALNLLGADSSLVEPEGDDEETLKEKKWERVARLKKEKSGEVAPKALAG